MAQLTTAEYTMRIAELAAEGMYEPGQYAKRSDLSAGPIARTPAGGQAFYVETTVPNEDREVYRVTVERVS